MDKQSKIKEKYFPKGLIKDITIGIVVVIIIISINETIKLFQGDDNDDKIQCSACINCYQSNETMMCLAMPSDYSCTFNKPPAYNCGYDLSESFDDNQVECIQQMMRQTPCTNCTYDINVNNLRICSIN